MRNWRDGIYRWKLEVGRKPRRTVSECLSTPLLGDWLLPPNNNWQPDRRTKGPSCLAFLSPVDLPQIFLIVENVEQHSGDAWEGGRIVDIFSFLAFRLSCLSFSTQHKLFPGCLIQQKAWKCSALSLCFAVGQREDSEGRKQKGINGDGVKRGGRRGLLVIELCFCC